MFHPRLSNKNASHGIVDPILSWFPSHLPPRNQVVQTKGFMYEPRLVTSDVIEGRFLVPLIFALYLDDVFDVTGNGVRLIFADDNKIDYIFLPDAFESTLSNTLQDLASLSS